MSVKHQYRYRRSDSQRGQGLVEFAMVLPLLLMLMMGILEFGRMLAIYNGVSNGAHEAARWGSVVGDADLTTLGAQYHFLDCDGMRAAAQRSSPLIPLPSSNIVINYDHGSDPPFGACVQNTQPTPPIANGDRVVVKVTATYSPILPLLPISPQTFTFTAARTSFPSITVPPDELYRTPCYLLTLNVKPETPPNIGNVATDPSADPACPSGQYSGAIRLAAAPANSNIYIFDSWSGGLTGGTNPAMLLMDSDKAVTATFIPRCYTLTVAAANGSVTPSIVGVPPNGTCPGGYTYDTLVSLTAVGNSGYAFANWSGDLSGNTNPAQLALNANKNVTARFVPVPCYTLTTNIRNGSGTISQPAPASNCTGGKYNSGTNVQFGATPAVGFAFNNWTDGSGVVLSADNPVTVAMDGDKIYLANFVPITCYRLNLTTGGAGVISVSPASPANCPAGRYAAGTVVTLTATPNTGYSFSGWSGAVAGLVNPVNLTMDADKDVTANFSANCYTLTVHKNPPANNAAGATTPQNCPGGYLYSTRVTVQATPGSRHFFSRWAGNVADPASPTTTVTMPAAHTSVTANFTAVCVTAGGISAAGKVLRVNYSNDTSAIRNLVRVIVTWPSGGNRKVQRLDFGGSQLWSGSAVNSPLTIDRSVGGWNPAGNAGLLAGTAKMLALSFSFNVTGAGSFSVATTFDDGCAATAVTYP